VSGEKIVAMGVGDDIPPTGRVIEAKGKYLIPGLVDIEHHPSQPLNETVPSETWAAAASGTTTVGIIGTSGRMVYPEREINRAEDMPSFIDATASFIELMQKSSHTDFFITPGLTTEAHFREIPNLLAQRGITSFKAYLHLMTGEHIWEMWGAHPKKRGDFYYDDGSIYRAMLAIAEMGDPGLLLLHTENWEIARVIKDRLLASGRDDVAAYSEFSPDFVEAGHVRNYAYYAKVTGCPIFIIHTTTPATIAEISRAKQEGTRITANITPHYLCLTPEYGVINVPLRPAEYHEAMWEALRAGAIDTVSSDSLWRATRTLDDVDAHGIRSTKKNAWLESYFNGSSGFLLPVMLSEGVNKGRISLEKLVEVCCENPARIFGVHPRKGTLTVGADADIVIVDLEQVQTIKRDMVISRGLWSVWEGWEVTGWPIATILRGKMVMERNRMSSKPEPLATQHGKYLSRQILSDAH
jgi:dihydropyrimidinase/dihydroorotase